jgi:hypothetical protein
LRDLAFLVRGKEEFLILIFLSEEENLHRRSQTPRKAYPRDGNRSMFEDRVSKSLGNDVFIGGSLLGFVDRKQEF